MFSRNSCFNFQEFSLSRNLPGEEKHHISVLASCNDLILCVTEMMGKNRSYFLCNPFTKQWVALPPPTGHIYHLSEFGLVCEPYCGTSINGGGNVINPRYRIVRFVHSYGNLVAIKTYHSETGQWVQSNSLGEVTQRTIASNIVAYNGKLCWMGAGGMLLMTYDPFNMGSSCTINLVSPLYQPSHSDVLRIGVSGGVLRIITEGSFDKSVPYQVWDLEELIVGRKWTIRLKHFNKDINFCCKEVAVHPTDKDLVYFHSGLGDTYREYNMESREFKRLKFRERCRGDNMLPFADCKIFPVKLPWWPTPLLDRSSATLLASEGPEQ